MDWDQHHFWKKALEDSQHQVCDTDPSCLLCFVSPINPLSLPQKEKCYFLILMIPPRNNAFSIGRGWCSEVCTHGQSLVKGVWQPLQTQKELPLFMRLNLAWFLEGQGPRQGR